MVRKSRATIDVITSRGISASQIEERGFWRHTVHVHVQGSRTLALVRAFVVVPPRGRFSELSAVSSGNMLRRSTQSVLAAVRRTALSRRGMCTAAESTSTEESSTTRRIGAIFFSSVVGGTSCLCAWQMSRYQWKVKLIEEREATLRAEAVPLRALVPDLDAGTAVSAEFHQVFCEGTFDHDCQVLVGPRSAPAGSVSNTPAGAAGPSGWDVITPLVCKDGSRVLVNRGWVARDDAKQTSPAHIEQPAGAQRVVGILKPGEAANKYAKNTPELGRYIWVDLPSMAEHSGSSPVLVVAVGGSESGGAEDRKRYPRVRSLAQFSEFHVKPSTHITYAATWGALSLAGLFITYKRFGGR